MKLPFSVVDVFTARRFAGNPLAIVEKADGLTDAQMLAVAREFNLSETIFVQKPRRKKHTARVRIFFPTAEIPFAGHPTIGCAIHLALAANKGKRDFAVKLVLEEQAGLVPVRVERRGGKITAQFTAPVVPFAGAGRNPDAAMAAAALGLAPADIGFARHEVRQWQGGPTFLFVPVNSRKALSAARPCEPAWSAMMDHAGVHNAYVYTAGGDDPATAFRARMFAPTAGTPEDPATGSASALLAAQLLDAGVLKEGVNAFRLEQGYEMGRPSDIFMEAEVAKGALAKVRIAGGSVKVSKGRLRIT
jgi:trans-2,3-dihydro-3-hydroxyanthranilate isomerase